MLSERDQHSSSPKLILPLVLLVVVTLLSIWAIFIYSIAQVNEESRISSEGYLAAIISDKLRQQETLTKDYAYWDDTIQNAYLSQNSKWIDENIGGYLTNTFKITDLFIIDGYDKVVLSLEHGQLNTETYNSIDKGALENLIVKARQSGAEPVPVSGMIMIHNYPAIVAAAVLTPEDGTLLPAPRPVLLTAKRLDADHLLEISKKYRLKDLHFSFEKSTNSTDAFIEIINPQNKLLGILTWHPDKPGNLILSKIRIPLLILLIVSGLITSVIIRAALNTTQRLKEAYAEMAHLANHDVLTGLSNRRLFDELLEQTINSAERDNVSSAMLYLDLDGFKKVNDSFGHHEGDKLLVTVAERIKSSVRKADSIARIGGDEFAIILRNTSSHSDIKTIAEKILASLEQPIQLSDNKTRISASIGITLIPQDGIDPDIIMANADLALYECKKLGRNIFRFYGPSNQYG